MNHQYSEHAEDCLDRGEKVDRLLKEGLSLEEALQSAFCLEKTDAQQFIGRFFADVYAEMMHYGWGK